MKIIVRLDHTTLIAEVDEENAKIMADAEGTTVEFQTHLPGVPTVSVMLVMDRKETLNLVTKIIRS